MDGILRVQRMTRLVRIQEGKRPMATVRILAVVTLVALVAAIIVLNLDPAFAQDTARVPSPGTGTTRGAPGPIAGAGLVTVLVGGVGYWLFRRFRKTS
jgi:hypothetical protein